MHSVVEKLSGEITQEYRPIIHIGLNLIDEIHEWRLGIRLKATGYRGDVHEEIRFENNKLRHDNLPSLIHTYSDEVHLRAFPQHRLQIRPVGLAVKRQYLVVLTIAYLECRVVLFLRCPDEIVIPSCHHHA